MADGRMRIDKWLWNVRIFKSRTKATDACKKGAVKIGEQKLKASSMIEANQLITVRKDGFQLEFKINTLIPKRVSSVLALPCYDNLTPQEELDKFKDWFIGKGPAEKREKGTGRPTKRDRREIDEFKDDFSLDDWFEI